MTLFLPPLLAFFLLGPSHAALTTRPHAVSAYAKAIPRRSE
ncbi:MAG TPA: hypothetical protein VEF90_05300 [Xanthobacteraceae bacterium]|nr:hypothetical protein [Xanthobacteraceae bacterium]